MRPQVNWPQGVWVRERSRGRGEGEAAGELAPRAAAQQPYLRDHAGTGPLGSVGGLHVGGTEVRRMG